MIFFLRLFLPLLFIIILVFVLPNIFNVREREHFSNERRYEYARLNLHDKVIKDTISIAAAAYYDDRSAIHLWMLGEKYRDLWSTKINVPVFTIKDSIVSYTCFDIGGGDQTINIKLEDQDGKVWTLRSIDKDQSKALSPFLQTTFLRPMVRDEVAAMNPYGAFVADDLAEAAEIPHTNPKLVFVPYITGLRDDCRRRMVGRMALLEEKLDKEGWLNDPEFLDAEAIVDTEDMFPVLAKNPTLSIDTLGYLKARLFDILICDWDRHEGQWAWALKDGVYHPIPNDRDMAFYLFDDGWINRFFLIFNNKFRTFRAEFGDISGFVKNSRALDRNILGRIPERDFIRMAEKLQQEITSEEIESSFDEYPPEVYKQVGPQHINVLKKRLDNIKIAAKGFFAAIHEAD